MVNRFLFKDRDGRTPLPEDFKKNLIPKFIQTGGELDEHEENNIVDGLVWLEDCKGDHLDWMFWFSLHKKLFCKVWKWAGKFREHELMNEEFMHPSLVKESIKKLEGDLQYWLKEKPFKDERETIVRFHERLLTIHPFSNGNGRTSRILVEYICKQEGITIPTWGVNLRKNNQKHREAYIAAVQEARVHQKYKELLKFMYS